MFDLIVEQIAGLTQAWSIYLDRLSRPQSQRLSNFMKIVVVAGFLLILLFNHLVVSIVSVILRYLAPPLLLACVKLLSTVISILLYLSLGVLNIALQFVFEVAILACWVGIVVAFLWLFCSVFPILPLFGRWDAQQSKCFSIQNSVMN